jgi:hypothetical protein
MLPSRLPWLPWLLRNAALAAVAGQRRGRSREPAAAIAAQCGIRSCRRTLPLLPLRANVAAAVAPPLQWDAGAEPDHGTDDNAAVAVATSRPVTASAATADVTAPCPVTVEVPGHVPGFGDSSRSIDCYRMEGLSDGGRDGRGVLGRRSRG